MVVNTKHEFNKAEHFSALKAYIRQGRAEHRRVSGAYHHLHFIARDGLHFSRTDSASAHGNIVFLYPMNRQNAMPDIVKLSDVRALSGNTAADGKKDRILSGKSFTRRLFSKDKAAR